MKFKRILSVLLACLMLTGILTVGANAAWTDPEKKTQGDWAIPLVGKYLAWPGEMLITKLLLPRLLGGVLNGLLSGLSLDGLFNDDTLNGVLVSLGDGLEPLASSLSMNVGALIAKFAPDAPASLKAATTTLPTNTVWGADKTNFAAKLATALRPALVLGYVASVQQTDPSLDVAKQLADSYATGIAPALI
ncbi:MAG: hypothetical protein FWF60_07500, partial [Oscillospiraceae bacterium]|nr:hypothetical protein [Oscillospiraceae bacterium]